LTIYRAVDIRQLAPVQEADPILRTGHPQGVGSVAGGERWERRQWRKKRPERVGTSLHAASGRWSAGTVGAAIGERGRCAVTDEGTEHRKRAGR